ncbi:MAG: 30S ribosomal protein S7 [Deltaproteobacteria bacterium]|nr:30S ribosomal protein S7 [Deltaproteobacteria bacterium]MBI4224260.1 30S ribosomal protein S7 [Deltaproteobacteria bacterium]
MPRKKRKSFSRKVDADLKYGDTMVSRLIGRLMWCGKGGVAEKIVYQAFDKVKEKKGEEPLAVFKKALENIKPQMEVRSRRVGGANYQVPMEVRTDRRLSLGLRWLIEASRSRGEKTMAGRLAMEILEAFENKGGAVRKKEETHRMAEANRAFAHYRW